MSNAQLIQSDPYFQFAEKLVRTNILSDPWLYGEPRFEIQPEVLSRHHYHELQVAAEAVGQLYQELVAIVSDHPRFLGSYFRLTPYQKLMWLASRGRWHGIARLDVFRLTDGTIRICEMNSDTPSGEAETVVLNRLLHPSHPALADPNTHFESRFCRMIMEWHALRKTGRDIKNVGIIYPTEMPEDLSMIRIYQSWFEKRGWKVTLGSPYNLQYHGRRLFLMNEPVDVVVRHYKTDWWGERLPVWTDEEPLPDTEPLEQPLRDLIEADWHGDVTLVNPLGSVLTQNKLTMAFFWEHIDLFSTRSRRIIRQYIPETHRLKTVLRRKLNKNDWVMKSDYGCEGDEVIIGKFCSDELWKESLEKAIPEHWILQRFFDARRIGPEELITNYGVYLIAGKAAGIFSRKASESTDYTAVTAATFIQ